jgi:hypothetical protein
MIESLQRDVLFAVIAEGNTVVIDQGRSIPDQWQCRENCAAHIAFFDLDLPDNVFAFNYEKADKTECMS